MSIVQGLGEVSANVYALLRGVYVIQLIGRRGLLCLCSYSYLFENRRERVVTSASSTAHTHTHTHTHTRSTSPALISHL